MIGSKDFNSSYRNIFGNHHIQQFTVYTETGERVGAVDDALVDPEGHFRYLIVNPDANLANHLVLVPLEQVRIDQQFQRVQLVGVSQAQVRNLPPYHPSHSTSDSPSTAQTPTLSTPPQPVAGASERYIQPISVPVEMSAPLEGWAVVNQPVSIEQVHRSIEQPGEQQPLHTTAPAQSSYNQVTQPQSQPQANPVVTDKADNRQDSHTEATIRLHEERLSVHRGQRRKVGEVVVRKEIETRLVEVPVRYEKLIVEQVSPNYEQLAVIDLDQTPDDALPSDALSPDARLTTNKAAATAAHQFLNAIAHHPNPEYSRMLVQITRADTHLQALYDQWLSCASRDVI